LIGRYCRLERLNAERHASQLFAANQIDAEGTNWTYLPYGPFQTLPDYRAWIERDCNGNDPLFFAIIDISTNTATGVASYMDIKPASGSIEVGHLNFSPLLQRSRGATEAMYLMMARAFESGYRRYQWRCNALNAPSRRAAQRLGLSFEGIFRQATVSKGRNRDTAWYAAIDSEWPALEAAFRTWLDPANFNETGQQRVRLSSLMPASR
jgi:RimJ/RimL family protein N-acetyltransferase